MAMLQIEVAILFGNYYHHGKLLIGKADILTYGGQNCLVS